MTGTIKKHLKKAHSRDRLKSGFSKGKESDMEESGSPVGSPTIGSGGGGGSRGERESPRSPGGSYSSIERTTSSSSAASAIELSAIMELRKELAEKSEEVELLQDRKNLLLGDMERLKNERDGLRREQSEMTERISTLEGDIIRIKSEHEAQVLGFQERLQLPRTDSSEKILLEEKVAALTRENVELRGQLAEAKRTADEWQRLKEAADVQISEVETQMHERMEEARIAMKAVEEEKERLEDELQAAENEVQRLKQERGKMEEEVMFYGDIKQEVEGKVAAFEAALAHKEFELASGLERAEVAEAALAELKDRLGEGWENVEELKREVERLGKEVQKKEEDAAAARKISEGKEKEVEEVKRLAGEKMERVKREKESVLQASERKMEALRKEISVLVEQQEMFREDSLKGRACIDKAEEYLRALEVARVEVKKLRLERDLLSDRLRSVEEANQGGSAIGWIMPNCLYNRSDRAIHIPDSPSGH